ncbi:helix-turn-helix domain-containing protein [Actinoplanes sp. SE50]|uniref:helix-turn-helix domain-containing protein n=1 Tax=unclassified Actinoplanes TaxID=2626549 RepID=UPI00023ECB25|nr:MULTISPECIES: helix-turn-helix transcriptional regulator [unclassified Actinoplanes]AEV84782.1 helix-turn-helix domain-containing protein [Actinoplanes sp. SE50/110]ATO83174.1 helix-turn-helix domain-containing protein [Actinoplanes sp. SE50]SLM00581.1 XRE family transcriptional regulator [Actinoplanes sp. SE50/110]
MTASETTGSTIPRRTLGLALRKAREDAGITMAAAADVIGQSVQSLRRIEQGTVSTPKGKVTLLCMHYGIPNQTRLVYEQLALETRSKGWWQSFGDAVPAWFELYVVLEQTADRIRSFDPLLVSGLLQESGYMDAAILAVEPDLKADEVAARAEVRRSRQRQLTRSFPQPPQLDVILTEPVLMVDLPEGVMRAQLWHLLKATELPHVSVRVIPLAAGLHRASVTGPFTLLDFPIEGGNRPPSTVYSESQTGAIYLDRPHEIEAYERVWNGIDAAALDQARSVKLMSQRLKELNDRES